MNEKTTASRELAEPENIHPHHAKPLRHLEQHDHGPLLEEHLDVYAPRSRLIRERFRRRT